MSFVKACKRRTEIHQQNVTGKPAAHDYNIWSGQALKAEVTNRGSEPYTGKGSRAANAAFLSEWDSLGHEPEEETSETEEA